MTRCSALGLYVGGEQDVGGGTTTVSNYEEGTLVIDIVHWEKKELAWRGMGTSILEDIDDPDKVTEYVNIWVGKILAKFPPKK